MILVCLFEMVLSGSLLIWLPRPSIPPFSVVSVSVHNKQRSRRCQREHWVIHKLCCGKSYKQVCSGKKALEESILAAAASSSDATKA